jgi:glycosyltransferase involved in cell wall biosynthesis
VPHLQSISGALRRILKELPVELVVVGDPHFKLPGAARVSARAWREAEELRDVQSFDIGLMPLPDDTWSRGKCGFKALLYMALGVPAVVSPVGVNRDIVSHGANGLLAASEDEWVDAVASLATDPALRQRLAEAGRTTVVERYSGQRWAPRFLDVLQQAADSRGF